MKWHVVKEDSNTRFLFRLCKLIYACEDLWVESGSEEIYVSPRNLTVYYESSVPKSLLDALRERYGVYGIYFKELSAGFTEAIHYRELYSVLKNEFKTRFREDILFLLDRTRRKRVEHALLLSSIKPVKIMLEGEEDRVIVPGGIRSFAFLHTHPGVYIAFSKKDLESAIDFFMDGGIIESVVAGKYMLTLWRTWMISMDDIDALIDFKEEFTSKNRMLISKAMQTLSKTPFKIEFEVI